jgi:dUTP pyrophosphatase
MDSIVVPVKILRPQLDLPLPQYMTEGSSGLDLLAAVEDDVTIDPGERKLIPAGIAIAIPLYYEGQVRPRSGLAVKYGITVLNAPGTIDSDYRGEICVALINLGGESFIIRKGDRIAQLIIAPVTRIQLKAEMELPKTSRDSGGFGHTGIKGNNTRL